MQVLRVCSFSTFSLPPAFPPCCCPLAFQRQVRRLTYKMSSESYPGYPECAVSCHGAGRCTRRRCTSARREAAAPDPVRGCHRLGARVPGACCRPLHGQSVAGGVETPRCATWHSSVGHLCCTRPASSRTDPSVSTQSPR